MDKTGTMPMAIGLFLLTGISFAIFEAKDKNRPKQNEQFVYKPKPDELLKED
jgi:hypothetical protein